MKKSILITIVSIIAIISLVFVFTACKDNNETPVDPPVDGELTETTFFTAAHNISNPSILISIMSVADNVEVYNRSSNGSESNPHNLPIDGGTYVDATTNFEYRGDAFSSTTINGKLFTGTIENPKEYLGIDDASVTMSNGKITIELKGSDNALKEIEVSFELTVDEIAYKATITLNP